MSPFDSARYGALLEGLEANVAYFSEICEDQYALRLDSEFFLKDRVAAHRRIQAMKNTETLGKTCSKIVQGPNPVFAEEGIQCLNGKNIFFGTADAGEPNYVSVEEFQRLQGYALKLGDLVITLKHASKIGRVWIIRDDSRRLFTRNVGLLRLEDHASIRPEVLLFTLWTSFYQTVLDRISTGGTSGQITLATTPLKALPIPIYGDRFQDALTKLFNLAEKEMICERDAALLADYILMTALRLDEWQPPDDLSYICRADEVLIAGRLDAEHFQPKYKALLDHVRDHAVRCRVVDEIAEKCDRGEQPKYSEDGTLAVVTSQHILENGLDYEGFERTDETYWEHKDFISAQIRRGDILTYTTGANVGRTAAYLSDERALASNHVNLLRLNEENPIYVSVVMNSMIGRMQTRMLVTGSAQVELYPQDIRRFVIPFVDEESERVIVDAVMRAYSSRRKAHRLLESAKRSVEIAIEESEEKALAFLREADAED